MALYPVLLGWPWAVLGCPAQWPPAQGSVPWGSLVTAWSQPVPSARSCLSPRKATSCTVPCDRNDLGTLPVGAAAMPWVGCAAGVIEQGAVYLSPCLGHRHSAGLQQLILLHYLPEGTEIKATLYSRLCNFLWHFTAKGKVLWRPQAGWLQGGSCCAAEHPSPAGAPGPTMAVLSSTRSTAAGSACSGQALSGQCSVQGPDCLQG